MLEEHDAKTEYCRMLGHTVFFSYCRKTAAGLPCRNIRDCWFESIPIADFLSRHFDAVEQEKIFAPPPPKVASLIDLIESAKAGIKRVSPHSG